MQRLFFALWPGTEQRKILQQYCGSLIAPIPGRSIPLSNWHLTLCFIGNCDDAIQQCLIQHCEAVDSPKLELQLDKLDYWKAPAIVWLGCQQENKDLQNLVSQLRLIQQHCTHQTEQRNFVPHLSLKRNVANGHYNQKINSIRWFADEFVLLRSTLNANGSQYSVVKRWPLGRG